MSAGRIVKVIFENCYLNDEQKVQALPDLRRGGGRLRQDLDRLRHRRSHARRPDPDAQGVAPHVKLKAAGGVRTLDGADRRGRAGLRPVRGSKTAEILDELKARLER